MVKAYTWSDIKARTTPEVRARIEAEGRRLSEGLNIGADAANPTPDSRGDSGDVRSVPDKDRDQN